MGDKLRTKRAAQQERAREMLGPEARYTWRSGIKHDCSKVMELAAHDGGYRNGLGEVVPLETECLFPMLKSSGVHRASGRAGGS